MRIIVTSQKDIAGMNIYATLAEAGFEKYGEFEGKPTFKKDNVLLIATEKPQTLAAHLDEFFDAEYYVFASKHRSESGKRTLTVHAPGNLTAEAKVGGRPKQLAYANASAMRAAILELELQKVKENLDYAVSFEATHHGPTELKKPVLFVEVGSTEKEWTDAKAVNAVARAVLKAAENKEIFESAVGIGGSHYAPMQTKIVLSSRIAIGHIIPTYAIDVLEKGVFSEAVERTEAGFCYLDWKGMKFHHREKIKKLALELGIKLKRGRDIKDKKV